MKIVKEKPKTVAQKESKSSNSSNALGNTNLDEARKALEGLNIGGGRNGGRGSIPEGVDLNQIRELFNRR